VQFYAALASTLPTGHLLLSTATLNSGGACTGSDDGPFPGCSRDLWYGIGGSNLLSGGGTIEGLATDNAVTIEVDHPELLNRGDLDVTTDNPAIKVTITDHSRATQFTVTFENVGSYSVSFNYTWARRGRLLQYATG
jgi:hypothetical protein